MKQLGYVKPRVVLLPAVRSSGKAPPMARQPLPVALP
jgi:hypothetical protein